MDKLENKWFHGELQVLYCDEDDFDIGEEDGNVGVVYSSAADLAFNKAESAFLFGDTEEDLYFRISFARMVKIVPSGESKGPQLKRLFASPRGALFIHQIGETKTEWGIPVYHDAIDILPHLRLDNREDGEGQGEEVEPRREGAPPVENTPGTIADSIDEIQVAVDGEVKERGGCVLLRFRPEEDRHDNQVAYDIVEIAGSHLILMYSPYKGDWLGEEEPFAGEPPMWFSELDHMTSPVYHAMKCLDFFATRLPSAAFSAVVIFPEECFIVNEDEMLGTWHDKCHVGVARTKRDENSELPSLGEFLSSLPGCGDPLPNIDTATLSALAGEFAGKA